MKKKYIRMTYAGFILFDGQLQHAAMAQPALNSGDHIISAGFFAADENGLAVCYGESVSLRVKSRPDDTEKLRDFLGQNAESIHPESKP
jgi:hypothetical protein